MFKNINNNFKLFAVFHIILWSIIPSMLMPNLHLDVVESIVWGQDLELGYYKHPPFAAWLSFFIYKFFGNNSFNFIFFSSLLISITFLYVYKLAKLFLDDNQSFISAISLDLIFYYNYTSLEFNPNILMICLSVIYIYYFYHALKYDNFRYWLIISVIAILLLYSKYFGGLILFTSALFLLINSDTRPKLKSKYLYYAVIISIIFFMPHLYWLIKNDFISIKYIFARSTTSESASINHFYYPIKFLLSQATNLILFILVFVMLYIINCKEVKCHKSTNFEQKFLNFMFLTPIIIILLISLVFGTKIRTMWGVSLWSLLPIFLLYNFSINIENSSAKKILYSIITLNILIIISLSAVHLLYLHKRTHFNGLEFAKNIEQEWAKHFDTLPALVIGDMWYAGNLSVYSDNNYKVVIDETSADNKRDVNFRDLNKYKNIINSKAFLVIYSKSEYNKKQKNIEEFFKDNILIKMPDIKSTWHIHKNGNNEAISALIVKPQA